MKAAGITLSTVGAGGGSNPFLQGLAKSGGGRFYDAANPASIPDIFLKETQQVSGQQIVEETFHPIITSSSPILRGLDEGFPQLLGYNGTTAKPAAQTVLVTARDDPLLAQWQFGLGRSVAWTSDSTGRWARSWVGWDGFTKFFSQLVGWTFPGEETGGIEASLVTDGNTTKLRVESVAEDGSPRDFYTTGVAITGSRPDVAGHRAGPDRAGRLRGAARRDRRGCLHRPGVADAPGIDAARADAGPRRADARRVPPPRVERSRSSPRSGPRPAGGRSRPRSQPWTHDLATTDTLYRPLADAADPRPPSLAARHRAAAGVRRRRELADARRWLAGGWRRRATVAPRPVEVDGHAGGARSGRGIVGQGRDPSRRCCGERSRSPAAVIGPSPTACPGAGAGTDSTGPSRPPPPAASASTCARAQRPGADAGRLRATPSPACEKPSVGRAAA